MTEIKLYTKAWFKGIVSRADENKQHPEETLQHLLSDLHSYIAHLDAIDAKRGAGTSEKKKASSRANGAKGGYPKGRPRSKKPAESPAE